MQSIVDLTSELIRFKTLHANPNEINRCADFICHWLSAEKLHYKRLEYEGYPAILAMPATGYAPILLMSHIDVVDAPDEMFAPRVENGRLHGRGSVDDKYAVALSLLMLKAHPDGRVGALITSDEEIGGFKGAKPALAEVRSDFCIALDGGNPEEIVLKEKGLLRLRLVGHGATAHGARPWLGDNAIENLMADYQRIKPFFDQTAADHWHRTLNLGIIRGGKSLNQVPDRAEALLDIRYTEGDDVDRLVAEMRERIRGELVVEEKEPMFIGGRSHHLDRLLKLAPEVKTGAEHGASDARHLALYGMKGIIWGAEGENSHHTENEYVVIDSLTRLYERLDRFIATAE